MAEIGTGARPDELLEVFKRTIEHINPRIRPSIRFKRKSRTATPSMNTRTFLAKWDLSWSDSDSPLVNNFVYGVKQGLNIIVDYSIKEQDDPESLYSDDARIIRDALHNLTVIANGPNGLVLVEWKDAELVTQDSMDTFQVNFKYEITYTYELYRG